MIVHVVTTSDCKQNIASFYSYFIFMFMLQRYGGRKGPGEMDIQSYLIKPVQRISRYTLIIKDLIKYTVRANQDCRHLQVSYVRFIYFNFLFTLGRSFSVQHCSHMMPRVGCSTCLHCMGEDRTKWKWGNGQILLSWLCLVFYQEPILYNFGTHKWKQ